MSLPGSFCSMQSNSEANVAYEAFDKSSAANVDVAHLLVSNKIHEEIPLEMCLLHLPHAGSDGSIASRLPFSTVAICQKDSVGVVRLVSFFDIFVPDTTRLRFSKASLSQRVLMLTVPTLDDRFLARSASVCNSS